MKKIKKVLLFIPPASIFKDRMDINPLPPLGLGYLGAVLEKEGFEVKIVDALAEGWDKRIEVSKDTERVGLSFDVIEKIIRSYGPDMVGVNNLFTRQRDNAHRIYEVAKRIDKDIVTVAGGAHATVMPELVLTDPNVDFVILGEGERTILDLLRWIENRCDPSVLDGIGFREGGNIRIIPKRRFIEDLDRLPFPAWHLLGMERYFGLSSSHGDRGRSRFSPVISSRGCPARCTFCSAHAVWGRKFRSRSPQNVIAELKQLKEKYHIEEVLFEDDNLTLDPVRAGALFDGMVREKLDLVWDTPNGIAAWTLSENLIDKMKASGCRHINFAIESGNQHVLDHIIKKPLNLQKIKPLVRHAKKIGLNTGMFLVVGMPHETEQQIWDSIRLSEELGIYTPHISIATPYPGSELYDFCKKEDLLRPDFSLDDLYIRSFCISTPELNEKKLKDVLGEAQKHLLMSFLKNRPLAFMWTCLRKLLKDPRSFLKKFFLFLQTNDWKKLDRDKTKTR